MNTHAFGVIPQVGDTNSHCFFWGGLELGMRTPKLLVLTLEFGIKTPMLVLRPLEYGVFITNPCTA